MTRLALSLTLTMMIGACGGDDLPTVADTGTGRPRDTGRPPPRDTGGPPGDAGCVGCRTAGGLCAAGITTASCGTGGVMCQTCMTGETCAEGVCAAPPTCGATCTGCCDAMDMCQLGTTEAACGNAGEGCTACPMGATCNAGVCELPCVDSCDGCCTAAGTCVALASVSDAECGATGAACMACPAGEMCIAGACVAPGCMTSCAGCCAGSACIDPATASQCGTGGNACTNCGAGTCTGGACTFSPSSLWDVTIIDGVVPDANAAGDPWDPWGGLPDPYAVPAAGSVTAIRTPVQDNTTGPIWNHTGLFGVPLTALRAGLTIRLMDDDFDPDDPMGECTQVVSDSMLGGISTFNCARDLMAIPARVGWSVRIRITPN